MAFTPKQITKELDMANLAKHNDNYNAIKTELDTQASAAATHTAAQTAHGSTPEAVAGKIMQRDSAGRAKVSAPAATDDIARKAEVDAVQDALDTHEEDAAVHLSAADRTKLDGIEDGAEPNQNAFAQVNNVAAASESDTLTITGGTGITISTNPTTKTVTVTATGTATPGAHGSSHNNDGSDPIPDLVALRGEFDALTAADIGAETPEGAQAKVNALAGEGNTQTVAEVAAQLAEKAQQADLKNAEQKVKESVMFGSALSDMDLNFNLPNCAKAIQKGTLKIAYVDNSIGEAANNLIQDGWFSRFIQHLKKSLNGVEIEFANFSLGGGRISQFNNHNYVAVDPETDINVNFWRHWATPGKSWRDHVKDYNADLTIFGFGMNDTHEPRADHSFTTNLFNAISYVKSDKMDIALVSTILPTENKVVYPQSTAETLNLARISREFAMNNNYALVDANRMWRLLLYGVDECGFTNKDMSNISLINQEKSYNFEATINFANSIYPTLPTECDMIFRSNGTDHLVLRFRNDGSNNIIELYSTFNHQTQVDQPKTWAGTQTVHIKVEGAKIAVNGEPFLLYEKLYDGGLDLNKISPHISSIVFNNRLPIREKPTHTELDILGAVTDPIGQGINGNGINHPTSLGHYLAYYMASQGLINSLKKLVYNNQYNISKADYVTDFNGGVNSLSPGKWRVWNDSGTAAHAPYSGACGGYVDVVSTGDIAIVGTKVHQTFYDDLGDVYYKVVVTGTTYGTWKKLT